ncbi:hypothetical protein PV08_06233 [Exophiala spinifera]|uniref:Uncharacterized protein n=1 Tax=Exophiala spinifera TaxID=91928 RepID=A0A0D1ZTS5_9EURO|nr:uncharacterized protein PV08_06233 [Exophiala spinifera]KIW16182.1 hypothetical protein PV08_06233 [Exophiala spinifera]
MPLVFKATTLLSDVHLILRVHLLTEWFAYDSAISVGANTPGPTDKSLPSEKLSETSSHPDLATRLNGLVSEIWAHEQDGGIRGEQKRKLEQAMRDIELVLEDDLSGADDSETSTPQSGIPIEEDRQTASEQDLDAVRTSLAATVEAMRMRHQEQRHLHQLTVQKLEAVAQRCLDQEKQLREHAENMAILQHENHLLRQQNDRMHSELNHAHTESAKKEVAVNAMSSAVSGLEGWINASPTPTHSARRVVTRGRGRFRGRYYVDETPEPSPRIGQDGMPDAKALHEGVTAWLRGFRDVEEELRALKHSNPSPRKAGKSNFDFSDDEWGDFESAPAS